MVDPSEEIGECVFGSEFSFFFLELCLGLGVGL